MKLTLEVVEFMEYKESEVTGRAELPVTLHSQL